MDISKNQSNKITLFIVILVRTLFLLIIAMKWISTSSTNPQTNPITDFFNTRLNTSVNQTKINALQQLLSKPMKYDNIQIEYRKKSKTYVVYFTGSEPQARLTAEVFFASYGIQDIKTLPLAFVDVNPITDAPPNGFFR